MRLVDEHKKKLNVLDLFSGIGGFSLGLEAAGPFRTVAFCEREPYCQAVLRKHWPDTPIYDDVRTIDTDGLGRVDIIVGGFPCQPWSQAGKQRGAEDDRDLWPEMAQLIGELRPRWAICENVRGFINQPMGLERSLSDLARIGYQAVPFIIPACAVDAPHRRDRVWIIAHADIEGEPVCTVNEGTRSGELVADARIVANSNGGRRDTQPLPSAISAERQNHNDAHQSSSRRSERIVADASGARLSSPKQKDLLGARWWQKRRTAGESNRRRIKPNMGRMADGLSGWMDEPDCGRVASGGKNRVPRLKALGNAVVPQIVGQIGRAILSAERGE